jgi:hypothetical protein
MNQFMQVMGNSMTKMDKGMAAAPMTGDVDHDFATMMPHHDGAIDVFSTIRGSHQPTPRTANVAQRECESTEKQETSTILTDCRHTKEIAPPLYGPISFAQSAVTRDSTLLSATFLCTFQLVVSMTLETCFVTSLPIR